MDICGVDIPLPVYDPIPAGDQTVCFARGVGQPRKVYSHNEATGLTRLLGHAADAKLRATVASLTIVFGLSKLGQS